MYARELKEMDDVNDHHIWVILAKAETFTTVPPTSDVVRVTEYIQSMAITDDNYGGTKGMTIFRA